MCRLAEFAYRIISKCGCSNTFHHVESGGVAKFNLWMPQCTVDMDPIVDGGAFQRLARAERTALVLLLKAILFLGFVDELPLQAFLFSIAIGLFLVSHLWWFVEIKIRIFVWA